jgi:hypothetical protein
VAASTGWILAAGAIVGVNEVLFVPTEANKPPDMSSIWRLIPVTLLLAVGMAGLERASPEFAVGMSKLLVLAAFIYPVGKAKAPGVAALEYVSGTFGAKKGG